MNVTGPGFLCQLAVGGKEHHRVGHRHDFFGSAHGVVSVPRVKWPEARRTKGASGSRLLGVHIA